MPSDRRSTRDRNGIAFTPKSGNRFNLLGWGVITNLGKFCDLADFIRLRKNARGGFPLVAVAALSACSPSIDEKIATAKSEWQELRDQEGSAWIACKYGPPPTLEERQAEGKRALAQWDVAAADAGDQMSPEQEMDARVSIAREIGISPSQVDLKGIYERRAEQAKAKFERKRDYDRTTADYKAESGKIKQGEACDNARVISKRKFEKYREMMELYREKSVDS